MRKFCILLGLPLENDHHSEVVLSLTHLFPDAGLIFCSTFAELKAVPPQDGGLVLLSPTLPDFPGLGDLTAWMSQRYLPTVLLGRPDDDETYGAAFLQAGISDFLFWEDWTTTARFRRMLQLALTRGGLQARARRQCRQLKNLTENLPGIAYQCELNADWTMHFISDEVEKLTGYPASDFLEDRVRSFASVICPEDRAEVEKEVKEGLLSEQQFAMEYRILHRNGEIRHVWERGRVFVEEGRPLVEGVILDRSEEKFIEELRTQNELRLRKVFVHMNEGLALHKMIVDEEGQPVDYQIVEVNPAFEKITGITRAEAMAKPASRLYGTGAPPFLEEFAWVVRTGETRVINLYWPPMRKYFLVSICLPLPDHFATLFLDVTQEKVQEVRLQYLNRLWQTIRKVNQLIIRERDSKRLIEQAVEILVLDHGYSHANIVLCDGQGQIGLRARSGDYDQHPILLEFWDRGVLPECQQEALRRDQLVVTEHSREGCQWCPHNHFHAQNITISTPLRHGRERLGLVSASVPLGKSPGEEERGLFQEIADDIAFALWSNRQKEQELQQRQLITALLEAMPSGIYLKDKHGRYISHNRAFQQMLPDSRMQVKGKTAFDLLPRESAEMVSRLDHELLLSGEAQKYEQRIQIEDGSWRDVAVHKILYHPGDEREVGILGVIHDITELKSQSRKLQLAYRALESSRNGIMIAGSEEGFPIIYVNDAFAHITGYDKSEYLGANLQEKHWPEQIAPIIESFRQSLKSHGSCQILIDSRRQDDTTFWIRLSIAPVLDDSGKATYCIAVAEDMTDWVNQQKELTRARDAAEEASRAKGEFLAIMSHEIRTPLNPILGFSHLLLQQNPGPQEKEFLLTIIEAAEQQLKLIDNILRFSSLEKSNIDLQWTEFPLLAICQKMLLEQEPHAHGLQLQLVNGLPGYEPIPENLVVCGECSMLQQLLGNLLGNACKYTPSGTVQLLTGSKPLPGRLRLYYFGIKDTGVGIHQEKIDHIFEPFYQIDRSNTRKFQGAGLGLAICRKLIDFLGGRIGVESEPGQGSLFWFTLNMETPVAKEAPRAKNTHPMIRTLPRRLRVLIVDDLASNRAVTRSMLDKLGCLCLLANDGRQAIEICSRELFDVIFMDLTMPVMDGLTATRGIRNMENANHEIPIIALTADVTETVVERCRAAGFSQYLSKPVKIDSLYKFLHTICQGRKLAW